MALNDISQLLLASEPLTVAPQNVSPQAFVWGQGGARLTPEDLARRRAIADQQTMGDYSPVQHWTQGLGRVVDGLMGGFENRRLDEQSAALQAEQQAILSAALGKDADLAPLLQNKATASIV